MTAMLDPREAALVELGRLLRGSGYQFVTVTPETHRRVNARPDARRARSLRDVFGWSQAFERASLPAPMFDLLHRADVVGERDGAFVSQVRFSTLGDNLFVHSAYPTSDANAVFFGPDTYRFCALLVRAVDRADRIVDVCAGCGVGGISLAERASTIVLADINPVAASFARVNAHLAGVADRVEVVVGDLFAPVSGSFDLAIANPPYLVDPGRRVYRDGGGDLGTDLAARIVHEALDRLPGGGRIVLYTGAPIVDGVDRLRPAIMDARATWTYRELDPDVFGEELDTTAYANVDRIAVVAAIATKR